MNIVQRTITVIYTFEALRPYLHDNKYAAYHNLSRPVKFVLVRISQDSDHLHSRHAKENETPVNTLYCWKFIQTPLSFT